MRRMTTNYLPAIANSTEFPSPKYRVNASQVVEKARCNSARPAPEGMLSRLLVDRARTGLFVIASSIEKGTVWLPDYHCPALMEPFFAAGRRVEMYPISTECLPNMDFLHKRAAAGDAVLAVRFFGFDSGISEMADLCSENDCILLEDLAHAACATNLYGDAAVTSLVKFYPLSSGGEILIKQDSVLADRLEKAHSQLCGRISYEAQLLSKRIGERMRPGATLSNYFDRKMASKVIRATDAAKLQQTDHQSIIRKRRSNYVQLSKRLSGQQAGTPLQLNLPPTVCPYVFPFMLTNESQFPRIRQAGVQALRWEEMIRSKNPDQAILRHRLVQIPLNQDLCVSDIDHIADAIIASR